MLETITGGAAPYGLAGARGTLLAIEEANALAGRDTICFNISTFDPNFNGTYWTITPLSNLPYVTEEVLIDGNSQNGTILATLADSAILKILCNGSATMVYNFPRKIVCGDGSATRSSRYFV